MDRIAAEGHTGLVRTIPEGFESGSDVATMCLLGYAPSQYHTGRAPLEAAAKRIVLSPSDWVFRCNLVTVTDGIA
jgi:2,3-bisphosphoglycerate-independent phosphoglycerate mutase